MTPTRYAFIFLLFLALPASAQEMSFEEYEPRSTLVVPENPVSRARFPFIDIHAHQNRASEMNAAQAGALVEAMDAMNMAVMVNLSGGSGDRLKNAIANLEGRHARDEGGPFDPCTVL